MAISTTDPMSEIKNLCYEIKRLVPPNKPKDPTGPFSLFMKNLENDVDKHELDSIHRAYNYFNCLLAMPPAQVSGVPVGPNVTGSGVNEVTPKPPLDEATQREMIHILVSLVSLVQ